MSLEKKKYEKLMEKAYHGEFLTEAEDNWIENLQYQDTQNKAYLVRTNQI